MKVTGMVLAGGLGRRMGGVDKGLVEFRGRPMVETVIERFRPQVDELLINANRNAEAYASFGCRVIPDALPDFAGPLAGLQTGLMSASHELVATVPCDSPFLPSDLISRLKTALVAEDAQLAVAVTDGQAQPVFCLCRRDVLSHLTTFLQQGGRKIDAWYATLKVVEVNFDDEADAFANINTPQELNAVK
jgi:molybdopterin-guanine dinucleotide biosynthesis protein A